jgi:hypothetical protein
MATTPEIYKEIMAIELPATVKYIKNGPGGNWWAAAKPNQELHLGWKTIPGKLIASKDIAAIEPILRKGGLGAWIESQLV